MIRILHRTEKGTLHEATEAEIGECLARANGVTWVDIRDETPPDVRDPHIVSLLRDTFHFHELAVDDALTETHVPKLDDWGEYLYIVLHDFGFDESELHVDTHELDIFIGANYLVTYRYQHIDALERVWRSALRDERHSRAGSDHLLYELCDAVASSAMPCVDAMDKALDALEDGIFMGDRTINGRPITERTFAIKRSILNLRRVLAPQREVMNKLARDDHPAISSKDRVYFRDVYDHFVRLADLTESLRDITSGALDTYLSVTANRTNDVMKTLTVVTVLFMPLSFLTGFFGMNFFGATYEIAAPLPPVLIFIIALTLMFGVPLSMFYYIKRRGWW